jgi:hypothetical protein
MPLLAGMLYNLFTALVSFFAIWMTKQVALRLAAIAAAVAFTAAFVIAINALISSITVAIPSAITTAASWVVPSNAATCLGVYVSALAIRWVYDWNIKAITLKVG